MPARSGKMPALPAEHGYTGYAAATYRDATGSTMGMKATAIFIVMLLAIGVAGRAVDSDNAPFISHEIKALTKKVDADQSAGTLTRNDADELKRRIKHVRSVEESEPVLTRATRRDLREELANVRKDLERKEGQGKAMASASP